MTVPRTARTWPGDRGAAGLRAEGTGRKKQEIPEFINVGGEDRNVPRR